MKCKFFTKFFLGLIAVAITNLFSVGAIAGGNSNRLKFLNIGVLKVDDYGDPLSKSVQLSCEAVDLANIWNSKRSHSVSTGVPAGTVESLIVFYGDYGQPDSNLSVSSMYEPLVAPPEGKEAVRPFNYSFLNLNGNESMGGLYQGNSMVYITYKLSQIQNDCKEWN